MDRRRHFSACAILALTAAPAMADWSAVRQLDEFDGKHRYIAITSPREPQLAFVCEAETGRVKLLFKTTERATADMRKTLPFNGIRIALIVDDEPVRALPGQLNHIDRKLIAQSYAEEVLALGRAIGAARRRVLVAIDMFGAKHAHAEFPVSGSAAAFTEVLKACGKPG